MRNGLYRSFCEIDLQEVKRIQQTLQQKRKFKSFDIKALFASFGGHSIFSLFEGEIMLFRAILHTLEEQGYKNQDDEDEEIEHPDLRRINQILC